MKYNVKKNKIKIIRISLKLKAHCLVWNLFRTGGMNKGGQYIKYKTKEI